MLDIHNHLLFGVDDGCQSIDQTIELLKKAKAVGVSRLVMTPHYSPLRGHIESADTIIRNFEQVKKRVEEEKLGIDLFLGREIDSIEELHYFLKEETGQTLHDSKLVLLDFGMKEIDIDEYCYELILKGYTPVISHPERYTYVSSKKDYKKWKDTGALIQINAKSIFRTKSRKIKRIAKYLLQNNLVDFVASDCHGDETNYEDLLKANRYIKKRHKGVQLKDIVM